MFTLEINIDHTAFEGDCDAEAAEVARLLKQAADQFIREWVFMECEGKLRDVNGNTVGKWHMDRPGRD